MKVFLVFLQNTRTGELASVATTREQVESIAASDVISSLQINLTDRSVSQ